MSVLQITTGSESDVEHAKAVFSLFGYQGPGDGMLNVSPYSGAFLAGEESGLKPGQHH